MAADRSHKVIFCVSTLAPSFLIGSSSFFAGLEQFHRLIIREMLLAPSTFIVNWIFFVLAGNKDSHKRLDEFEFRPDSTTDC